MAPAMISPCVRQALDAGVDQALAELVEVEEADEEGDEAGEVEHDDAARQARGGALHEQAATSRRTRLRRRRRRMRRRRGAAQRDVGGRGRVHDRARAASSFP